MASLLRKMEGFVPKATEGTLIPAVEFRPGGVICNRISSAVMCSEPGRYVRFEVFYSSQMLSGQSCFIEVATASASMRNG